MFFSYLASAHNNDENYFFSRMTLFSCVRMQCFIMHLIPSTSKQPRNFTVLASSLWAKYVSLKLVLLFKFVRRSFFNHPEWKMERIGNKKWKKKRTSLIISNLTTLPRCSCLRSHLEWLPSVRASRNLSTRACAKTLESFTKFCKLLA